MNKKEILIYSNNRPNPENISTILGSGDELDFTVINDYDRIYQSLEKGNCDFIIIDTAGDIPDSHCRELFEILRKKNIPVLFADLDSTRKTGGEQDSSSSPHSIRRLVLKNRARVSRPAEDEDLKIVNRTAATLCHEINNPLMVIAANVEVLLKNYGFMHSDIIDKIKTIGTAAERIRKATDRLTNLKTLNFRETVAGRMIVIDDDSEMNDYHSADSASIKSGE
nr:hypothetical protein [candidate division Zixibacteria bacterium]